MNYMPLCKAILQTMSKDPGPIILLAMGGQHLLGTSTETTECSDWYAGLQTCVSTRTRQ